MGSDSLLSHLLVIPAKVGIQRLRVRILIKTIMDTHKLNFNLWVSMFTLGTHKLNYCDYVEQRDVDNSVIVRALSLA